MLLAPTEKQMWEKKSPKKDSRKMTDEEINQKYDEGQQRILTEINREKLPSFADALKKSGYMNINPFYQRRLRWDKKKQSRLIESFLVNIPVPPIILYEIDYNSYEVMDGQQRITAIRDFYDNKLELTGLEIWTELNGRTYEQLPTNIKAGIDRRSISSIVLITESTKDPEEELFLKQITFERLNTGGEKLTKQEVRNCIYSGKFNQLLFELSNNELFAKAWDIPIHKRNELTKNTLYKKMEDLELILRFFAFRHIDDFTKSLDRFLDSYMAESVVFSDNDIDLLKQIFTDTIKLANQIYEDQLFKPFDSHSKKWKNKSYKAYFDAVMVGFSRHLDHADFLVEQKLRIIEETKKLFKHKDSKLFTGLGKSKKDLKTRIDLFDNMLAKIIAE